MANTNAVDAMLQPKLRQPYITMDFSKPPKGYYSRALGGVGSQLKCKSSAELLLGDEYPEFVAFMEQMKAAKKRFEEEQLNNRSQNDHKTTLTFPRDLGSVSMFRRNLSEINGVKVKKTTTADSTLTTYTNPQMEVIGTIKKQGKKITANAGNRTCIAPAGKKFEECTDIDAKGNKRVEILYSRFSEIEKNMVEIKESEPKPKIRYRVIGSEEFVPVEASGSEIK